MIIVESIESCQHFDPMRLVGDMMGRYWRGLGGHAASWWLNLGSFGRGEERANCRSIARRWRKELYMSID